MFEIEKTFFFSAGHSLESYEGKCRNPHGHSYTLKIRIRSEKLQESKHEKNMVADFQSISSLSKPMIKEYFDHKWLNDTLQTDSPTVEFITKWIYTYLKPLIPQLYSITIFETPKSMAIYYE